MKPGTQTQQLVPIKEETNEIENTIAQTKSEKVNEWREFHRSGLGFTVNFTLAHIFGILGLALIFQGRVMLSTIIFAEVLAELSGFGITIGGHRLWAHRSFKAKAPLKNLLAICFFFAGEQSIWLWCSWHRLHHKCVDTDADPHNSNRGFFYSHIGWLLTYDHKRFMKNFHKIDVSDLEKEPVIMFHEKYYHYLHLLCIYILPTLIPWYFFGETFFNSFCVAACLRYIYVANRTFCVNSVAHLWGDKPYDTNIRPVENIFVSLLALGEGWHNYHHVFPWDYKAAELGFYRWNLSTAVIDFFAWVGWAYDLKSVSKEVVLQRVKRTGDPNHFEGGSWGWGDRDIPEKNIMQTETIYPAKGG